VHRIGIDLGGTKIEGICLDDTLKIMERKRIPTNQQNGYKHILGSITSLINDITKNISDYSIGVCTPGAISKKNGFVKNSNTQYRGKRLIQKLKTAISHFAIFPL